jgi:chromosome segregation ATPase
MFLLFRSSTPNIYRALFPQKKGNQAETKPFTNFSVFHDNLITRLKALSQIQLDFDKRVKEVEAKFTEKLADMRRQLDTRWKQIDKFESSVKAYGEAKATWRRKFTAKEGELEALKVGPLLCVFYPWALTDVIIQIMKATNADLTSQITVARRPAHSDSQETKTLLSRAVNAEKRLVVVQNQLLLSEEKMANVNQRTTSTDQKWEARVKEYEARLKAGEEKYKRERQGAKERVLELENQLRSANLPPTRCSSFCLFDVVCRSLERQNELVQKRSAQLDTVAEANKVAPNSRGR